jgi:hypothetical protein
MGIGLLLMGVVSMVEPAAAQTETGSADAGDVVVADPVNVNRALREGDSTSAFTFRLPEGASCPGDSANDDWRVSTFLVPADTNLDTLTYQALRPDGEAYRSLRYLDGDIYVMEMTNANPGPGEPGLITPIPPLTMAWFETGSLEAGPYKMGIACTDASGAVQRYWDTAVELTTAPDVDPGGLRWSVEPASGPRVSRPRRRAAPPRGCCRSWHSSSSWVVWCSFAVVSDVRPSRVSRPSRVRRNPYEVLQEATTVRVRGRLGRNLALFRRTGVQRGGCVVGRNALCGRGGDDPVHR